MTLTFQEGARTLERHSGRSTCFGIIAIVMSEWLLADGWCLVMRLVALTALGWGLRRLFSPSTQMICFHIPFSQTSRV